MKVKVVVLVNGGVVQRVGATEDIDYIIIDEDEPSPAPLDVYESDELISKAEFERMAKIGVWVEKKALTIFPKESYEN